MSKERRALLRFEPRSLTTAALRDSKPKSAYGVLSNISELGLCLVTDSRFALGRDLQLLVCLNRLPLVIRADARIVWMSTDRWLLGSPAGSYLIGAQFRWMPHSDRRCLQWALSTAEFKRGPGSFRDPITASLAEGGLARAVAASSLAVEPPTNGTSRGWVYEPPATSPDWLESNQSGSGVVLVILQGMSFPDRLCSIVRMAGFHAVTTHSPETAISKVRVLRPALVVFSQRVGRPGVSETARRIKKHTGEPDTPLMILTEDDGRPYLSETSYPVEACFPASADTRTLVRNIRLLARKPRRRPEERRLNALEGNIEGSTISEVLQYLSTAGKTGSLSVRCGRRGGRVYLDRGELVHAFFGPLIGVEACHAIVCLLQEGYFEFESDVRPTRTTMRENGVELILEWAREMDEIARRRRGQPVDG